MKKISPGVYVDERGGLHLFVGELLRHAGYSDNPRNRDTLTAEAVKVLRDKYPDLPLTLD